MQNKFQSDAEELVKSLAYILDGGQMTLATAESCTGGRIASMITSLPGCSSFYKGGVVAYSNEVKERCLGVRVETLQKHGAVSAQTVCEMAEGVRSLLHADCAVATSGVAGPEGGTPEKPVGTIWIAVSVRGKVPVAKCLHGDCGRERNACNAALNALKYLVEELQMEKCQ